MMNFPTPRVLPTLIIATLIGGSVMPQQARAQSLSASPLAAFGGHCANSGDYGPNTFTLNGSSLSTANLTVGPLTGFTFSTVSFGFFSPSLSIPQSGGGYSRVIYVKFTPTAVNDYSGNIPIGGGGAASINLAASGSGIDPAPTATSGAASAITASSATLAGQTTPGACSATTAYGIEYSTVNGFANGTGTQVPGTNLIGTDFSCALSGLSACTIYYFKAYATNSGGTGYGAQGSFSTAGIGTPVATDGTSIGATSFDANWDAVAGATGYFLDVSTSPTFGFPAANVVGWNFDDENKIADSGVPANTGTLFTTNTTGYEGYSNGVTGRAFYKKGWGNGSGSKYWKFTISTLGYATLTVSSVQRSWNAGPRDFKIQYKVGTGGVWTDVPGGSVTCANDFISGKVTNLPLPAACNNQPVVVLRWIMTSNVRVGGSGTVLNGGSNVVDDFSVDAAETPDYLPGYENLSVGNVTTHPVTGLDPNTTYYYRVRATGSGCTSPNSNTISVTTTAVPIYYSRATGTVLDPIWSDTPTGTAGPAFFTAASSMVVQSGDVVTNTADVDLNNLTVDAGGTLVLNAITKFNVHGNADFNGSFTANDNSTFAMLGTTGVTLNAASTLSFYNITANVPGGLVTGATLKVRGTLMLEDGNFDASTGNLTLASNITGTGSLGPVAGGANYLGNMTVERYIPAGHTNWRMLGSAVAGKTVSAWQDDFFTAGYPGSAYPNFFSPVGSGIFWPSIRYYNETNPYPSVDTGMVGVTSNLMPLATGQGFMVWSGDNLTTTSAFVVDVTGVPNIGTKTLPMTFTSSGSLSEDGWNMVSNPFPSPIAFDSISLGADVNAQYWVFDPATGTQQTYSGGIGQGNVNGIIQSSQGFWLKAEGAAVSTSVSENDKVEAHTGGVFGGNQQAVRPIVRLVVSSAINTYSDEATLIFDQGTPGHDAVDAFKNPFRTIGAPQVSIMDGEGERLAMDFYGAYTTAIEIPLLVSVDVSGTYTISAGITGVQNLSCLSLEDLATGTITPLTDGTTYSFAISVDDDETTPRFLLHGTAPLPFHAENATCANTPNGTATVVVANGPVDLTWTDAFGNVLLTQAGVADGVAVNNTLAEGNYTVRVSPIGACGEMATDFSISAPVPIDAFENASQATSCPNSADGSMSIEAVGGTGQLSYLWNDGTTDANFSGAAGEQSVSITDETGCSLSTSFLVPAGEGAVAGFTVGSAMALEPVIFTNTSTQSNAWTWDFGDGTTSTDMDPTHTYASAGDHTVTLTATDGNCTDVSTQVITVEMATAIGTTNPATTLNAYANLQQLVIDHPFGNAPVDVAVYDATGRMAMSRKGVVKPNTITLSDRELGTGVWFVRVKSGDVERTFRVPLIR